MPRSLKCSGRGGSLGGHVSLCAHRTGPSPPPGPPIPSPLPGLPVPPAPSLLGAVWSPRRCPVPPHTQAAPLLQSCHLSDWPAPLSTAQKCPLPAPSALSSLSGSAFHLGLSSNRRKGWHQRPAERRCVAMWLGVTLDLFPESTPFRPGTQGDRQLPQERCCHHAARSTSRRLLAP